MDSLVGLPGLNSWCLQLSIILVSVKLISRWLKLVLAVD